MDRNIEKIIISIYKAQQALQALVLKSSTLIFESIEFILCLKHKNFYYKKQTISLHSSSCAFAKILFLSVSLVLFPQFTIFIFGRSLEMLSNIFFLVFLFFFSYWSSIQY